MRWILPFALAGLAAFGTAEPEVFDFGELDQYNPKEVGCPIANSILAKILMKSSKILHR